LLRNFCPVANAMRTVAEEKRAKMARGAERIRPVYKIAQAALLGGGPSGEPVS
jgi:hypothetical protein